MISSKEKALEIYNRNLSLVSLYFKDGKVLAIEMSLNEAKSVLCSFDDDYSYSEETKGMEWTSDDTWLFSLYRGFWEEVILHLLDLQ